MKVICRPRQAGKTTELIKLAHEGGYKLIVVHTREEAHRVFKQAHELKMDIPLPITYKEFIERQYAGVNVKSILIDNVEMFVQTFTNVPVEAISVNNSHDDWLDELKKDNKDEIADKALRGVWE